MGESGNAYVEAVAQALEGMDAEADLLRENPVLLLGSGRTVESLPPPPSNQQQWNRVHRDHYQYFLTIGRDRFGPIMVWGCMDCGAPEPDALAEITDGPR